MASLLSFGTLAIQTNYTWLRMAACSYSRLCSECVIDDLSEAAPSPSMIVVRNDPVRGKVARYISPGAPVPVPVEIKQRMKHCSSGICNVVAQRLAAKKERFQNVLLAITDKASRSFFIERQ